MFKKMFNKVTIPTIVVGLVLVGANAYAVTGGTIRFQQRDPTNTAFQQTDTDPPVGGGDGLLYVNGTSTFLKFLTFGSGLTNDGTSISVAGVPTSSITGLSTVATSGSYTDLSNKPAAFSFNNTPSRSIVTTAAAANGFQISSTRNATASYSITITASASGITGGASSGYVVYEIAATNSATAGDWTEIGRWTNGQTFNSILTLTSTQPIGMDVMKIVPAGYYMRLRSVNVSGTPTYTVNSGQEVLL